MSVTVTGTWTSDSNSDNTAPSSVLFSVQSSAIGNCQNNGNPEQAGLADDGLHDPFDPNAQSPGTSDTPKPEYKPSQSGSISITLPLSASGSGTPGLQGGGDASASVGPITIAIHAQPYNFRRTYFPNVTPQTSVIKTAGELQFQYKWSSTDGVMGDLAGETIHENVDAPSSPSVTINGVTQYAPPAPFGWGIPFHFDSVAVDASSVDGITDSHSWGNGQAPITDAFAKPYQANSFNLTQNYKFNDPATMQSGTEQQIPGNSGPLTITDAVIADPNSASGYSFTVTKDGSTSLPQPLP